MIIYGGSDIAWFGPVGLGLDSAIRQHVDILYNIRAHPVQRLAVGSREELNSACNHCTGCVEAFCWCRQHDASRDPSPLSVTFGP